MQEIDRISIEEEKIPSLILMENAAKAVVREIVSNFPPEFIKKSVIVSGKGNNGGDGIAVGRILRILGFEPSVFVLGELNELSKDSQIQAEKYSLFGNLFFSSSESFYDVLKDKLEKTKLVIDAILGTGTKGKVLPKYEKIIALLNSCRAKTVSIDIPSGLSGDSFFPLGIAVKADITVTLGGLKLPLVSPECEEFCGKVIKVDIGLSEKGYNKIKPYAQTIDIDFVKPFFVEREKTVHKGNLGHLLIVAGSKGKLGASILSAKGALRAGCGLVTVAIPESLANFVTASCEEAMTLPLPETKEGTLSEDSYKIILDFSKNVDALSIGPGISTNDETAKVVRTLFKELKKPAVFDADGINAFEKNTNDLDKFEGDRIITPHPGEFGRILGLSAKEILKDRYSYVQRFSKEKKIVTALKGYKTILADKEGFLRINTSGGSYMAGPGMGDVLTGMVGALLARKVYPFDAASISVFWHGLSAQMVFEQKGYGIVASEVADFLPFAESFLRNGY